MNDFNNFSTLPLSDGISICFQELNDIDPGGSSIMEIWDSQRSRCGIARMSPRVDQVETLAEKRA